MIPVTAQQKSEQAACRDFVRAEVVARANEFDREERLPAELIESMARRGYLGALVPAAYGGSALDMITFGLLNEEIGQGCSSLGSLLTVHSMVTHALLRWGSELQRETWLPRLATGEVIGAFALSEAGAGSDAQAIATTATPSGDSYILSGQKTWISFGQVADLFLVFARCGPGISAFLVERGTAGCSTEPITGLLGMRASMLARLDLRDCRLAREQVVGRTGFGLSTVAHAALDIGRYSVAWGCVGIAQACLDASLQYARARKQFGVYLHEHQLVAAMIAEMITNVQAARLLCFQAGHSKDSGDPETIMQTWMAKYFASRAATRAASDAVQIHGANGCSDAYPVQRYLRDAKIMEIIEGSTQIQQIMLARHGYEERAL
jgi:alkylation response protein AidB-like acyl-CoA dehydrogenase